LPTKIVHEGGGASGEEHRAIGLILPDDFQKLAEGKLILKGRADTFISCSDCL
jgi:hypothetical protein